MVNEKQSQAESIERRIKHQEEDLSAINNRIKEMSRSTNPWPIATGESSENLYMLHDLIREHQCFKMDFVDVNEELDLIIEIKKACICSYHAMIMDYHSRLNKTGQLLGILERPFPQEMVSIVEPGNIRKRKKLTEYMRKRHCLSVSPSISFFVINKTLTLPAKEICGHQVRRTGKRSKTISVKIRCSGPPSYIIVKNLKNQKHRKKSKKERKVSREQTAGKILEEQLQQIMTTKTLNEVSPNRKPETCSKSLWKLLVFFFIIFLCVSCLQNT